MWWSCLRLLLFHLSALKPRAMGVQSSRCAGFRLLAACMLQAQAWHYCRTFRGVVPAQTPYFSPSWPPDISLVGNPQASRTGAAFFSTSGRSYCGVATFGQGSLPDVVAWHSADLGNEAVAAAAEVVMGRADMQELTASSVPIVKTLEVRKNATCLGVWTHVGN